ncbi:MAG: lactonase family protein [Lachnospiraceae bacterium]|nr:lactonase family protein [Lachnospiraceae bacterium]
MSEKGNRIFYVSGYGSREEGSICRMELSSDGTIRKMKTFSGLNQPSYIALRQAGGEEYLYSFEKDPPDGAAAAFRIRGDELERISYEKADFLGPCHVSLSERGDFAFFASYGKGTAAVYRIREDGGLAFASYVRHEGKGKHPIRQDRPHVHFLGESGGQLFAADLGLDKVFIYDLERESGRLRPAGPPISLPAGAGPRHLALSRRHPERLYILTELTVEVCFCEKGPEGWSIRQKISAPGNRQADPALMVPAGADPLSIGAAIKLSEDEGYLFTSARLGFQSLSAFRVEADGFLTFLDTRESGGVTPRDFALIGDLLVIANQDSDLITTLRFDREKERLLPAAGRADMRKPTCVSAGGKAAVIKP